MLCTLIKVQVQIKMTAIRDELASNVTTGQGRTFYVHCVSFMYGYLAAIGRSNSGTKYI